MLPSDPVFQALTRPQMVGGVTYSYMVFNLLITVEAFLITKAFWVLPIALAVHGLGYLACRREPRIFDLWLLRARTCPRTPNRGFWGANSYMP